MALKQFFLFVAVTFQFSKKSPNHNLWPVSNPTRLKIKEYVSLWVEKLNFPGAIITSCASITTTKCLINSTVSITDARLLTLEINFFYYNTPMNRYKYMKIPLSIISEEIITQYNLCAIAADGWVYMDICKGMPGLK